MLGGLGGASAATGLSGGSIAAAGDAAAAAAGLSGGSIAAAGDAAAAAAGLLGGSIAAAGSTATAISTVSGVGGTGASFLKQSAQNNAAQANAAEAKIQASQAGQAGIVAEQQQRIETSQAIGNERNSAAAGGVDPNSGSALTEQEQTKQFGEYNAQTTKTNYENLAKGYEIQSTADLASQVNPALAAGTTALGYAAAATNQRYNRMLAGTNPYLWGDQH